MRPLIIVPFHDPKWLDNTRANLARQTVKIPALVVLNGPALDLEPDFALYIEDQNVHCHADAVNRGAIAAERTGFTHAICFDSDDYYGSGYVAQALKAFETAEFIGKRSVYTWLGDGLHLFERTQGEFLGGTIAFAVDRFVPMPAVYQDDTEWCWRMAARGAIGKDTGPSEFCYRRHGSNAHWQANDVSVRRSWGESKYFPDASIEDVSGDPGDSVMTPTPTDAEVFAALGAA